MIGEYKPTSIKTALGFVLVRKMIIATLALEGYHLCFKYEIPYALLLLECGRDLR